MFISRQCRLDIVLVRKAPIHKFACKNSWMLQTKNVLKVKANEISLLYEFRFFGFQVSDSTWVFCLKHFFDVVALTWYNTETFHLQWIFRKINHRARRETNKNLFIMKMISITIISMDRSHPVESTFRIEKVLEFSRIISKHRKVKRKINYWNKVNKVRFLKIV